MVQRWILARLRNRRFFSLAELNAAIRALVADINDRPMRGWGTTRRALIERFDQPALLPSPSAAYEYADWKRCRVSLDYHVEVSRHFYSVPFQLIRQEVEARIATNTVETSSEASWWRRMCGGASTHRPPRWSTTCRARTGATAIGAMSGFCARLRRLVRMRLPW